MKSLLLLQLEYIDTYQFMDEFIADKPDGYTALLHQPIDL